MYEPLCCVWHCIYRHFGELCPSGLSIMLLDCIQEAHKMYHSLGNECERRELSCLFGYRGQSESHFGMPRRCMSQGI